MTKSNKKKTYLVTGAAGFIGSVLAKRLLLEGNNVVTVDNLSTGVKSAIPLGAIFYEGNCQDISTINLLEKYKFDAIFHIAGQSSGEISFEDPVYDLQTNAQSTLLLLNLALKTKCKTFIYASTMSVYGDQPDVPVKENTILAPLSFYGVGKIASEHYMRVYQHFGVNSTALRLFNVYGPGQNLANLKQGMISIFLKMAIDDKNIIVKGSKNRYRDFIYIDDVVNAFILALGKRGNQFNTINISTGIKTPIHQLVKIIINNLPFKVNVQYFGTTPGDQFGIVGESASANNILNWKFKYFLEEGIKLMVDWALLPQHNFEIDK